MSSSTYDVVIAGASIAGCSAAIFFARRGLKVALLERRSSLDAYKKVCTHFIQPSATPTLERLGLVKLIEAAGGLRNSVELFTPFGWLPWTAGEAEYYGYNITREKLDPMLRKLAAETEGVTLLLDHKVTAVLKDGERVVGVTVENSGEAFDVRATLVVGADGRGSKVGDLAGIRGTIQPHGRFMYYAYYRNLKLVTGRASQLWFCNPDVGYAFPNEDGLTIALVAKRKEELPAFKADIEGNFLRFFAALPRAPQFKDAERVSEFLGMLEMPNQTRPVIGKGIAFVGDAATTSDPVWAIGCGWALQSAEWLADSVGEALVAKRDIDEGLAAYAKIHAAKIGEHHKLIADQSGARKFNAIERFLFWATVRDEKLARGFAAFGTRRIEPREFMTPATLARALWIHLRRPPLLGVSPEPLA
jgi:menaquinone-9 beta-reductase